MAESVGLSLEVDDDGDLVLTTDEFGNIDLKTIEGTEEVRQAIRLRLGQVILEDLFHPLDGLDVQNLIGPVTPDFVIGQVAREIAKDPRVEEVIRIEADLNRETRVLSLSANVLLKDETEIDVATDLGV